jgi:hypothetical protein
MQKQKNHKCLEEYLAYQKTIHKCLKIKILQNELKSYRKNNILFIYKIPTNKHWIHLKYNKLKNWNWGKMYFIN